MMTTTMKKSLSHQQRKFIEGYRFCFFFYSFPLGTLLTAPASHSPQPKPDDNGMVKMEEHGLAFFFGLTPLSSMFSELLFSSFVVGVR
jgi:hypothetical protein